jgi:hypothetical protein
VENDEQNEENRIFLAKEQIYNSTRKGKERDIKSLVFDSLENIEKGDTTKESRALEQILDADLDSLFKKKNMGRSESSEFLEPKSCYFFFFRP